MSDKCIKCGRCCHHLETGEPCPFLGKDNLCTVYEKRFKVRWHDSKKGSHRCLTIEEAIKKDRLPKDCPERK